MATSSEPGIANKRKSESLIDMSSKKKNYKEIAEDARRMVANVYNFLRDELQFTMTYNEGSLNLDHWKDIKLRTAEACGVSLNAVAASVKYNNDTSNLDSSEKIMQVTVPDLNIEDTFTYRRTVLQYLMEENITLPLITILKRDCEFFGNSSRLDVILSKLGFQRNNDGLVELCEQKRARHRFLEKIVHYRGEDRPIAYIGEMFANCTWKNEVTTAKGATHVQMGKSLMHTMLAVSKDGFIPNSIIHKYSTVKQLRVYEKNQNKYLNWLTCRVIPNLTPKSVIVVEPKMYENIWFKNKPGIFATKGRIIEYLIANEIFCDPHHTTKTELLALVETIDAKKIARHLHSRGFDMLQLPPNHKELNAVEMVLELVKKPLERKLITSFDVMTDVMYKLASGAKFASWFDTIEVYENEFSNLFDCDRQFNANAYFPEASLLDADIPDMEAGEEKDDEEVLLLCSSDDDDD